MSARPETIAQLNNWLETQRRRDIEDAEGEVRYTVGCLITCGCREHVCCLDGDGECMCTPCEECEANFRILGEQLDILIGEREVVRMRSSQWG